MSPALWPRSTAESASSIVRLWVTRRCIDQAAASASDDRVAIEALFADDHQPTLPHLVDSPGAIEGLVEPRADALYQQAHRFAVHRDEALHAQHVVAFGDLRELAAKNSPARRLARRARRNCRNHRDRARARHRGARGAPRGRPRPWRRGRAAAPRRGALRASRRPLTRARHGGLDLGLDTVRASRRRSGRSC